MTWGKIRCCVGRSFASFQKFRTTGLCWKTKTIKTVQKLMTLDSSTCRLYFNDHQCNVEFIVKINEILLKSRHVNNVIALWSSGSFVFMLYVLLSFIRVVVPVSYLPSAYLYTGLGKFHLLHLQFLIVENKELLSLFNFWLYSYIA